MLACLRSLAFLVKMKYWPGAYESSPVYWGSWRYHRNDDCLLHVPFICNDFSSESSVVHMSNNIIYMKAHAAITIPLIVLAILGSDWRFCWDT